MLSDTKDGRLWRAIVGQVLNGHCTYKVSAEVNWFGLQIVNNTHLFERVIFHHLGHALFTRFVPLDQSSRHVTRLLARDRWSRKIIAMKRSNFMRSYRFTSTWYHLFSFYNFFIFQFQAFSSFFLFWNCFSGNYFSSLFKSFQSLLSWLHPLLSFGISFFCFDFLIFS